MFDSHCHLDDPTLVAELPRWLDEGASLGITGWFVPGVSRERQAGLRGLNAQHPELCFGAGIHPWYVDELGDQLLSALRDAAEQRGDAVAIGECGLDSGHAKRAGHGMERQVLAFESQLALSCDLQLPVVLHIVGAHGAALKILRRFGPFPQGGVLHAYSGSAEFVGDYEALGLSFGVGGLSSRSGARRALAAVLEMSSDRLLLETDAPDMSPEGVPPGHNTPLTLPQVAQKLAELRGETLQIIDDVTTANARRLYSV